MIGIIDYGAGNLKSVKKALDFLGVENRIIRQASEMEGMQKLILPGVGAFQSAMKSLERQNLIAPIREWLKADKPFLGICLGMQLLMESSEESTDYTGFGVFRGTVRRFEHRRVPQIGWNQVAQTQASPLWKNIPDNSFFYFIHGYYVAAEDASIVIGKAEYGIEYTSAIQKGNIFAVQFHPEKSARLGLQLLKNWVKL